MEYKKILLNNNYTNNNPKSSFRNEKIFNASISIFSQIMHDYDSSKEKQDG